MVIFFFKEGLNNCREERVWVEVLFSCESPTPLAPPFQIVFYRWTQ